VLHIKKNICVIGLGYIGLPTAAMFASHGYRILGVDTNNNVVNSLNEGRIIIEEPYLDVMVKAAVSSGNLRASASPEKAGVFIICVPTPIKEDNTADMSHVRSAAESIIPYLEKGNIVILESTSPPRTVTDLLVPILERSGLTAGKELFVAHTPERVLPGRILLELVENDRIIGGINKASSEAVRELYATFVKGQVLLTDSTTAEMSKLVENTFRDVNIALSNELALICENMGINVWDVISLANRHPRVNMHTPGPGVGGHCIAVDPWFIAEKSPELADMIMLGRNINDSMPYHVYDKSKIILSCLDRKVKITVLGVTYKPNVDDIRESPILKLIELYKEDEDIEVLAADPHVKNRKDIENDVYKAANNCDLLILGVNHSEFGTLDFGRLKSVMAEPNILDTRNFWNEDTLTSLGFNYYLLGKGQYNKRKGRTK
jgi:UDP-N-acetyl-D-mannosaminuronic acid dehydrogenase